MPQMLIATTDGLHPFDDRGRRAEVQHLGRSVTALAPAGSDLWAVLDGSEIWHAAGAAWRHVADLERVRATCLACVDQDVFVGSSEARLFRVAGEALEPVSAFDDAEGRSTWYTPWGGPPDTRGAWVISRESSPGGWGGWSPWRNHARTCSP